MKGLVNYLSKLINSKRWRSSQISISRVILFTVYPIPFLFYNSRPFNRTKVINFILLYIHTLYFIIVITEWQFCIIEYIIWVSVYLQECLYRESSTGSGMIDLNWFLYYTVSFLILSFVDRSWPSCFFLLY